MKKYKNLFIYLICLVITLIIFIPFLTGHYASDTYNIEAIGYKAYAIDYNLKDGRLIIALFNLIVGKLNLSINLYVFLTLFLALVISNIAVITFEKIIEKYKKPENIEQEIILILISYVCIFNFMYMDCLNFVESCFMALSILLFIKSANIICQGQKKSLIKGGVLAVLATMCYQATTCIFISILFLLTILKNKNDIKLILKDIFKGAIIVIIALGIDFIAIKIAGFIFNLDQNRVNISTSIIAKNIILIYFNILNVLDATCNMFPKNWFLIYIGLIIIISIVYAIKYNKERSFIYKLLLIIIVSILSSFLLNIISTSSFNSGRTKLSIGITIGIALAFLFVDGDVFKKQNIFSILFVAVLFSYIVTTIYNYEYLMKSQKDLNVLEKQEIMEICDYIKKYEESNNIKINNITKVLFKNQHSKQYYKQIPITPFTTSVVRTYEFADRVIRYYLKENVEQKDVDKDSKEVQQYINLKDNYKGYECIGDTLYLSTYAY